MLGLASPKSDVFALGVILYELVMGSPGPRVALPSHIHGPAAHCLDILIEHLCAHDSWQRPTSAEAIPLIDSALRTVCEGRRATMIAPAPIPMRQPAPQFNSGRGWGWLAGAAALGLGVMAISNGGSTWDPSTGRHRGVDGRFKSG